MPLDLIELKAIDDDMAALSKRMNKVGLFKDQCVQFAYSYVRLAVLCELSDDVWQQTQETTGRLLDLVDPGKEDE